LFFLECVYCDFALATCSVEVGNCIVID